MVYKSVKEFLNSESSINSIVVKGWVRTKRDNKHFCFLEINDGSCIKNLQVVADEGIEGYENIKNINTGASVNIYGDLIESLGKGQKWEVKANKIVLIGEADPEVYPLQKKRHSDEFLRQIAHLRPRTNKYGAIFRIRSEASFAVHNFFRERGFYYIHTPIITGSDCEGAGEMFRVTTLKEGEKITPEGLKDDFFGKAAYLTVSGQLNVENFACSLGKVYTFGPTFRAENSNTPKHASEFWMIEPEVAFATLKENMELAEDFVKYLISYLLKYSREDLELFFNFVDKGLEGKLNNVLDSSFERLEYRDAIKILEKSGKKFEFEVGYGKDLQTEHERYLTEEYFKKPVFVINYPKTIKPFYMYQNDDKKTVAAMDLLVPGVGELIGGSQREDRLDLLKKAINDLGMNEEDYWWYLELRKYGTVPHSGFGLGFERFLMFVTGVSNIRDVIPFPRTPKNLEF
ncbi:asparagine--tRNA ligase [Deferribacterales bacterium Es71-Z0220]|uniref:asparagine--tRNA ligase n=1 Tax=Deferrivibrio essentukiensis TaxID=2880922 RepID=UPI001F621381|nr:asparagine--tRNA ligase [Deferrivibrio essentukiensis]MCB4203792.1 asparagine--tRNA ligase [Deferrivibrio essentukiensis]